MTDFSNGDEVRVKDGDSEIFTVSQLSENKCWIGDENGSGWYIYLNRLELVNFDEDREIDIDDDSQCLDCCKDFSECTCDSVYNPHE